MSVMPQEHIRKMLKMSDKDYFAIDALSNSDFRLLKESVLHYENKHLFPISSASMIIGSAVHCLVLEPHTFQETYIVEDFLHCDKASNTKLYKQNKALWLESINAKNVSEKIKIGKDDKSWYYTIDDKIVLSSKNFKSVAEMAERVNAIAGNFLSNGVAERAFISDFDGVPVKCKADYYREDLGVVIDLKTTKSIKDFKKSILEYGYGTQSAFYTDVISSLGYRVDTFLFILVETTAPYMVSIQEMSYEGIEEGRAIYSELLQTWRDYKENNIVNVVKTTNYPEWFLERRGA